MGQSRTRDSVPVVQNPVLLIRPRHAECDVAVLLCVHDQMEVATRHMLCPRRAVCCTTDVQQCQTSIHNTLPAVRQLLVLYHQCACVWEPFGVAHMNVGNVILHRARCCWNGGDFSNVCGHIDGVLHSKPICFHPWFQLDHQLIRTAVDRGDEHFASRINPCHPSDESRIVYLKPCCGGAGDGGDEYVILGVLPAIGRGGD